MALRSSSRDATAPLTGNLIATISVICMLVGIAGICSAEPLSADEWNDIGVDFFENQSYEDALFSYEKAIEIDSKHEYAWYNKGLLLLKEEQFDSAAQAFFQALDINASSSDSWYNLGIALENSGNSTGARFAFTRSEEIEQTQIATEDTGSDTVPSETGTDADVETLAESSDAMFDALYQKNDAKITEDLHQITSLLNDARWTEADTKALSTSKYLVEYINELKALELSDSYDEIRESYIFFLDHLAEGTNEISEIASLYPIYFNHGNVNYRNKGDEEDYYRRLQSAITIISSAQDELDRFKNKYFS